MPIIFYDIPSKLPDKAWSANTWKIRCSLNYKGIPCTTEWMEYPDIETFSKKHNIKPTTKKPDGRDHYTLPAIHDSSTGVYIADFVLIAEYLDRTYPRTPTLFPKNTQGLQLAFFDGFFEILLGSAGFVLDASSLNLNPGSREWFRQARAVDFGVTPDEIVLQGERAVKLWAKFEENLGKVDGWYAKTDEKGSFMMGEEASWADIMVVAHLMWMKRAWGDEDKKWKDVASWHGGRWSRLLNVMDRYALVT